MLVVLSEPSDLVDRLRAGDESAFAAIVRSWSPAMLRIARAHVHSHATAEDVVQEAWCGAVRALHGFAGRSSLRTWVFRIVVHTARRHGAREARTVAELAGPTVDPARFHDEPPDAGSWRHTAAPSDWGPEPVVLAAELRGVLTAALDDLPPRQRAVVELRDVHGLCAEEVCELLDLTPPNQRVLLHRGRAHLRTSLEAVLG